MAEQIASPKGKSFCMTVTEGTIQKVINITWTDIVITSLWVVYNKTTSSTKVMVINDLKEEDLSFGLKNSEDFFRIKIIYGIRAGPDKEFKVVAVGKPFNCSSDPMDKTFTGGQAQGKKSVVTVVGDTIELFPPVEPVSFSEVKTIKNPEDTKNENNVIVAYRPPGRYVLLPQGDTEDALFIIKKDDNWHLFRSKLTPEGWQIPLTLMPRCSYECFILRLTKIRELDDVYIGLECPRTRYINTAMIKEDVIRLQTEKAEIFVRANQKTPESHMVKVMFRHKPEKKMKAIMDDNNGVMEKYVKDKGGDPHCPINNSIDGLFFSISLNGNKIPDLLFYGNTRLCVPVEALFEDDMNLYFADFFCTTGNAHYATLVLTKQDSESDMFCLQTIPKLDPFDNVFFWKTQEGAEVTFHTTTSIHVEVLYTEDVDIRYLQRQYGEDQVYLKNLWPGGVGESRQDGLPKGCYHDCQACKTPKP